VGGWGGADRKPEPCLFILSQGTRLALGGSGGGGGQHGGTLRHGSALPMQVTLLQVVTYILYIIKSNHEN